MMLLSLRNLLLVSSLFVVAGGTLGLVGAVYEAVNPAVVAVNTVVEGVPVIGSLLAKGCTNGVKLSRFLTFFRGVDKNRNNVFEYRDYNDSAAVLLSVANYTKLKPEDFYDTPNGLVPRAFNVFPIINMPMHVYLLLATIVSSVEAILVDRVNRLGDLMFTAFDYKGVGDQKIDREECCGMWTTFGPVDCSPSILYPAFDELDANKDGGINKTEFINLAIQYFNSSDPNCTCRYLLGPKLADIPDEFLSQTMASVG